VLVVAASSLLSSDAQGRFDRRNWLSERGFRAFGSLRHRRSARSGSAKATWPTPCCLPLWLQALSGRGPAACTRSRPQSTDERDDSGGDHERGSLVETIRLWDSVMLASFRRPAAACRHARAGKHPAVTGRCRGDRGRLGRTSGCAPWWASSMARWANASRTSRRPRTVSFRRRWLRPMTPRRGAQPPRQSHRGVSA
jgi:hypothetical protein